jgi:hypothetical protein
LATPTLSRARQLLIAPSHSEVFTRFQRAPNEFYRAEADACPAAVGAMFPRSRCSPAHRVGSRKEGDVEAPTRAAPPCTAQHSKRKEAMERFAKSCVAALFGVASVFAAHAAAQSSGGSFRIERSVIAGGGGLLGGGAFQLSGTVGQNATTHLSGSRFGFDAGFWPGPADSPTDSIFANSFEP